MRSNIFLTTFILCGPDSGRRSRCLKRYACCVSPSTFLLQQNGESKQRQLEEIHVAKSELESKLIHARENQQRLFEQFKSRLDTQHGQLVRAKTRETKARRLLDEKCTECDDLKLSLHDSLGLGGTQQQRRVGAGGTPQRSSKVPFR